ncbi:MAG: cyclopropane-fatty-acyl-phospholipid synthase [Candidatus Omnitrophota bacterium]|jgi:cyclopropane-fatty-acyl-phospholipid synthase
MNMLKNKFNLVCLKIIDQVFRPMDQGQLDIILPDGEVYTYGSSNQGIQAKLYVNDMGFFRKCVLHGAVGFGESYTDGDWSTDSLVDVISWMIDNHKNHPTMSVGKRKANMVNFLHWANVLRSKFRINSLSGSKRNIMEHYDLGNEFFKTFLDPTMTYSAAYFSEEARTLEDAQLQKYDRLCQKLKIQPTDHVLEIGTGWGGFAVYAVEHYGCEVTTTTISEEQYKYAKRKIASRGFSDKINIKLCDYRNLKGTYDKIVSVEMIEAVGHKYYESYFKKCHDLLSKNGLLALQMIQFPDHRYDDARKNIDWIQKYIFPGSLLPSNEAIHKAMKKTGTLGLFHYEDITPHYAKTLKIWREEFVNNIDKIEALGKDEVFKRKWVYYLAYCEAAFKMRHINVSQAVYTRSNNTTLHDSLEVELNTEDNQMLKRVSQRLSADFER